MSQDEHVVREALDAFNRQDADKLAANFAEQVQWDGPSAVELPGGGRHEGREAVAEALITVSERWQRFRARVDEVIEAGGTLVALGEFEGKRGAEKRPQFRSRRSGDFRTGKRRAFKFSLTASSSRERCSSTRTAPLRLATLLLGSSSALLLLHLVPVEIPLRSDG